MGVEEVLKVQTKAAGRGKLCLRINSADASANATAKTTHTTGGKRLGILEFNPILIRV